MWRLDDIGIFVSVVEEGSFVRAAKRLDIPTSTVSRRLSELEAALGTALIERTSRKIHVTEQGQQLYEQCVPHVKEVKQQVQLLTRSLNQVSGKIVLTAPTYLGNAILAPWLCAFLKEYPDLELDLKLSNKVEDLLEEGIDLAIRIGPLSDSQFIAQFLCTSESRLYASPDYLKNHLSIDHPADLANHHVMLMSQQGTILELVNKMTEEHFSLLIDSRIKCNEIEMIRQAALNDLGIASLPHMSVQKHLSSGRLLQVLPGYALTSSRGIYAVYPSRKHLAIKTRLLVDYLKNKLAILG